MPRSPMVAAHRWLSLLWVLAAPVCADGAKNRCDRSCQMDDEVSLIQVKSDSFRRDGRETLDTNRSRWITQEQKDRDKLDTLAEGEWAKEDVSEMEADEATGGCPAPSPKFPEFILVEFNMDHDKEQMDGRYLFFKNRWWPWFVSQHQNANVLLHLSGFSLRPYAPQAISGQIMGYVDDLFAGNTGEANYSNPNTGKMKMEVLHRCSCVGIYCGRAWLSNNKKLYDKSGSSCTKMYNHTNITVSPHSIKFGGRSIWAMDSGKDTLLAARMFRNANTGTMAAGHYTDILLGSWNLDPTDPSFTYIYGAIPLGMHFTPYEGKVGSGYVFKKTCSECPGLPTRQNYTDYAISGYCNLLVAQHSFKDKTQMDTWLSLGHNAMLMPPTVMSMNMFPAINITRGVHMPLVYKVNLHASPTKQKKAASKPVGDAWPLKTGIWPANSNPKTGTVKVNRSPGAHKPPIVTG